MSIVVTGATGHLGRLIVESLLRRGVPAGEIVAVGRDLSKIADLGARGVVVRPADYDGPDSLRSAFAGAEKLMFVSGSEVGRRVAQHRNVIAAATAARVRFVVHTSIPKADTAGMRLPEEHRATDREINSNGPPYLLLRHGRYDQ